MNCNLVDGVWLRLGCPASRTSVPTGNMATSAWRGTSLLVENMAVWQGTVVLWTYTATQAAHSCKRWAPHLECEHRGKAAPDPGH